MCPKICYHWTGRVFSLWATSHSVSLDLYLFCLSISLHFPSPFPLFSLFCLSPPSLSSVSHSFLSLLSLTFFSLFCLSYLSYLSNLTNHSSLFSSLFLSSRALSHCQSLSAFLTSLHFHFPPPVIQLTCAQGPQRGKVDVDICSNGLLFRHAKGNFNVRMSETSSAFAFVRRATTLKAHM